MKEELIQGIVLRATPFKDRQYILTLLSKHKGIVNIILKGVTSQKNHLRLCCEILSEAEFLCRETPSSLFTSREASLIDCRIELRKQYSFLTTGMHFAKTILDSQYPGKPSPELYYFFSLYVKHIPSFEHNFNAFTSSFYLKLLNHEGLFTPLPVCEICQSQGAFALIGKDFFCQDHLPSGAILFSKEEWSNIHQLSQAASFSCLKKIHVHDDLKEKIEFYYTSSIQH